jgi:hypothetical protein
VTEHIVRVSKLTKYEKFRYGICYLFLITVYPLVILIGVSWFLINDIKRER